MIHFFLERGDIRKLEFLRYMEKVSSQKELREVIIKDLSISEFLLNKVIDELNNDFETYHLENEFKLIPSSAGVKLEKKGNSAASQLELLLVKDSLAFSLITEIFFGTFTSINEYSEHHFISYSSVYNKMSEIKTYLKQFGFTVTKKNELSGNEKKIRLFFSYLFTKVYNQNLGIYPKEVEEKSAIFIYQLEKYRQQPLKEYPKIKLSHYINVVFLRVSQNNYLKKESLHVERSFLKENKTAVWLTNTLKELGLNVPNDKCICEIDELFCFLKAKELIEVDNFLNYVINQNFKIYSFNFMNATKNRFPDLSKYIDHNMRQIDLIHFNALYFILPMKQPLRSPDSKSVAYGFPDYVTFCQSYIKEQKNNQEIWKLNQFFFYKYLLILVNGELLNSSSNSINLYVDFSDGQKYTNLILGIIKRFLGFEIIYQEFVNDKTDIILSDVYFENYNHIYQVTWETSPDAADWEKFILELEKLRKNN